MTIASLWQTPHASTRRRTCPGPGAGTSRSTSSSAPPAFATWTARILAMAPLAWRRSGPARRRAADLARPGSARDPHALPAGSRPAPERDPVADPVHRVSRIVQERARQARAWPSLRGPGAGNAGCTVAAGRGRTPRAPRKDLP
ncbi:hypothetical protein AMYX_07420 [Anaeromyxobacter diazotrophicus]|uniref:Uncharacterized protein n=1 Tax=Anaeromyxobacter diazotrophicus TaxID=2590199 RepID=A0A7I9VHY1_9BACT|nr:hypothetical protein AMYX_07420 [Anaeromyxobacter diazotrophicus]